MTEQMHDAFFADQAWQGRAVVLENVRIARDTYRIRLDCPDVAPRITPGQFVMLRLTERDDPLLGRPLALYDTVLSGKAAAPSGVDIVYLVIGKMTRRLAVIAPGQEVELWGPLGNGFPARPTDHLVMAAGGIGQTPFLALAREYLGQRRYGDGTRSVAKARRVTLCYGARSAEYLAGVDDFERLGVEVLTSTDDGTAGHHGLVTEVLETVLRKSAVADGEPGVVCCGPEPMMKAVAEITARHGVPCQVSLESPMACGVGICFSCVARVRDDAGEWDYRRTCVEGPVFDAQRIVF